MGMMTRQILSYAPQREKLSTQLKLDYNPYPLSQTGHTSAKPTVSLRDYHKTVISDILDKGDNVWLLNIHTSITYLYFILFH